jgi:hypothetical protein
MVVVTSGLAACDQIGRPKAAGLILRSSSKATVACPADAIRSAIVA